MSNAIHLTLCYMSQNSRTHFKNLAASVSDQFKTWCIKGLRALLINDGEITKLIFCDIFIKNLKIRMFSWKLIKENVTENLKIMKANKNSTFLIKNNDENEINQHTEIFRKKLKSSFQIYLSKTYDLRIVWNMFGFFEECYRFIILWKWQQIFFLKLWSWLLKWQSKAT